MISNAISGWAGTVGWALAYPGFQLTLFQPVLYNVRILSIEKKMNKQVRKIELLALKTVQHSDIHVQKKA